MKKVNTMTPGEVIRLQSKLQSLRRWNRDLIVRVWSIYTSRMAKRMLPIMKEPNIFNVIWVFVVFIVPVMQLQK